MKECIGKSLSIGWTRQINSIWGHHNSYHVLGANNGSGAELVLHFYCLISQNNLMRLFSLFSGGVVWGKRENKKFVSSHEDLTDKSRIWIQIYLSPLLCFCIIRCYLSEWYHFRGNSPTSRGTFQSQSLHKATNYNWTSVFGVTCKPTAESWANMPLKTTFLVSGNNRSSSHVLEHLLMETTHKFLALLGIDAQIEEADFVHSQSLYSVCISLHSQILTVVTKFC